MATKTLGMKLFTVLVIKTGTASKMVNILCLSMDYIASHLLGTVLGTQNTNSLLHKDLPFPEYQHSRERSQKNTRKNQRNMLYLLNSPVFLRSQLPKIIPDLKHLIIQDYLWSPPFPIYTPYYVRGYIPNTPYIKEEKTAHTWRLKNDR